MSTELAVYTIAFENRIDVSKELTREDTAEVRALVAQLRNGQQPASSPIPSRPLSYAPKSPKPVTLKIADVDFGDIPALRPVHAGEAKLMSEKVYPLIYIFENSVRDLIERILSWSFGQSCWGTAAPKGPRETAQKHLDAERKDPWRSKVRSSTHRLHLPQRALGDHQAPLASLRSALSGSAVGPDDDHEGHERFSRGARAHEPARGRRRDGSRCRSGSGSGSSKQSRR
jgi:hypothetical protein